MFSIILDTKSNHNYDKIKIIILKRHNFICTILKSRNHVFFHLEIIISYLFFKIQKFWCLSNPLFIPSKTTPYSLNIRFTLKMSAKSILSSSKICINIVFLSVFIFLSHILHISFLVSCNYIDRKQVSIILIDYNW